jgi:acyl-CoA synthetase (AMP-forming)/AMP-acid ligase II
MIVTEILKRNARIKPNGIALIERHFESSRRREITWQEFDQQADRIASHLAEQGVRKGDRVLLMLENCLEWLPVIFGILRAGCVLVPLDHTRDLATTSYCIEKADPVVFIFGWNFLDLAKQVHGQAGHSIREFVQIGGRVPAEFAEDLTKILAEPAVAPAVSLSVLDDAVMCFTSGSTGPAKAALLAHRNIEFACYLEKIQHGQTSDDVFLCLPPLFHIGAFVHWCGGFLVGATSVILKTSDVFQLFEAISEEGVTVVWLVVPLAKDILCRIEEGDLCLEAYKLDQWRLMHMGAQPIPPTLIAEWLKIFPNHSYNTTYGLTETSGPGCIQLGMNNFHKVGAIGKPGFDWEVRIVDEQMQDMPPGLAGQLILKGPGVMKEYYGDPEATAKSLVDGWFLTHDIAMRDEDGFIWYIDRKDDVISVGGRKVYPVELENFFLLHSDIQDVAVFGLHREGRDSVAVLIQPKAGYTLAEQELRTFCEALPTYKRPERYIIGQVPRSMTGKIEKYILKEQYAEGQSSQSDK